MKLTLQYRNPTPAHCDVAVFVNGALAGELRLRQEEVADFTALAMFGPTDADTVACDTNQVSAEQAWNLGKAMSELVVQRKAENPEPPEAA